MSKRAKNKFEPRPRDFFPTQLKAVLPLIPYLRNEGIESFAEPCCGKGDLVRHLESLGFNCVHSSDLNRGRDALGLVHYGNADAIVTNPPYTRKTMHALIRHFLRSGIPVWLLIDTDWAFTQQAAPFLPACSDIVVIGRVRWIEGSDNDGYDNFAWYRFDADHTDGPRLHWQGKAEQAVLPLPLQHRDDAVYRAEGAAMSRQTLPQRRRAETFTVVHWNQPFVVTVGFFDDGTPGEVFVDSRKTGGDVEAIARDAAVVISLALQHGAAVETLRHAITRSSNGAPSSILGAVIDALAAIPSSLTGGSR